MRNLKLWFVWWCAMIWVIACGQAQPDGATSSTAQTASSSSGSSGVTRNREMIAYKVTVTQDTAATAASKHARGRSLSRFTATAAAQTYAISLTGCLVTPNAVVTVTSGYLEVYQYDKGCLAKLTTFTLNDIIYTPKTGSTFSTWQIGDTATFAGSGAHSGNELLVTVLDTISNTSVAVGGTIHYQFSQITKAATDTLGESVVGATTQLAVDGQDSPNFQIVQTTLVGLDNNGNGEFQFVLECNDATNGITGTDAATWSCFDVRLNSINLVLAEDTYGIAGPSPTDLANIYTAASGGIKIANAAMFTAGQGTPVLANGGFSTAAHGDANVMVMSGSKPIHTHPDMLLILNSGPSYTYFPIHVTVVTQSGT